MDVNDTEDDQSYSNDTDDHSTNDGSQQDGPVRRETE